MKIVYLTDQIYLHGGVEKVLSQKANYLADVSEDEVIIVTYNQKNNQPCYTFSSEIKFVDLGINYEIGKSYFHPSNLKRISLHKARLVKVLDDLNPDIIINCSIGPDFYFLPFIRKHIPKVKEFHATRHFSSKLRGVKKELMRQLSRFVENSYTQLVILNEDEEKYYHSNNLAIIPNPAELDCPQAVVKNKKIISAGRIAYQKNFEDLILIGGIIFKEFPDWQIHIYGDDYLGRQAVLQADINKAGLSKNILFKGTSPNLKKTFLDYSIYAMTSNHETFPMVLLEALSVGLPVVSYDCPTGPSRILIDKEDSFLIPYKNIDNFVEQLIVLMRDENQRLHMGNKGRDNVQRFSIDKVMYQWKNLFDSILIKNECV